MSTINVTNIDPGEGAPLPSDNFVAVYGGKSILDIFYPVGSYYETSDANFDPNVAWGGVWREDTYGRVTVAYQGNNVPFNEVGKIGGEQEHTLLESELPKISGTINMHSSEVATNIFSLSGHFSTTLPHSNNYKSGGDVVSGARSCGNAIFEFGSDGAHNNLQPYIVVKRWHRVS